LSSTWDNTHKGDPHERNLLIRVICCKSSPVLLPSMHIACLSLLCHTHMTRTIFTIQNYTSKIRHFKSHYVSNFSEKQAYFSSFLLPAQADLFFPNLCRQIGLTPKQYSSSISKINQLFRKINQSIEQSANQATMCVRVFMSDVPAEPLYARSGVHRGFLS